tara:strand:- start:2106 stop:2465 length:360 start_codon:yes stop_codon:yes gene_type:complete
MSRRDKFGQLSAEEFMDVHSPDIDAAVSKIRSGIRAYQAAMRDVMNDPRLNDAVHALARRGLRTASLAEQQWEAIAEDPYSMKGAQERGSLGYPDDFDFMKERNEELMRDMRTSETQRF